MNFPETSLLQNILKYYKPEANKVISPQFMLLMKSTVACNLSFPQLNLFAPTKKHFHEQQ